MIHSDDVELKMFLNLALFLQQKCITCHQRPRCCGNDDPDPRHRTDSFNNDKIWSTRLRDKSIPEFPYNNTIGPKAPRFDGSDNLLEMSCTEFRDVGSLDRCSDTNEKKNSNWNVNVLRVANESRVTRGFTCTADPEVNNLRIRPRRHSCQTRCRNRVADTEVQNLCSFKTVTIDVGLENREIGSEVRVKQGNGSSGSLIEFVELFFPLQTCWNIVFLTYPLL